ncbi:hypothetical protein B0H10DRAFT_2239677 [Mycena sp. CBHHK59/15]|nr:hypothetical protein B0H10DRAFT_2239677 [Mycena sp. CBHHK59/15]
MFSKTLTAVLLLTATGAHAAHQGRRTTASPSAPTAVRNATLEGRGKNYKDSDFYVAPVRRWLGLLLAQNYNDKSAVATCIDECATCPQWGQIDLMKGLFQFFEPDLDVVVLHGSSYIDDDDEMRQPAPPSRMYIRTKRPEPHTSRSREFTFCALKDALHAAAHFHTFAPGLFSTPARDSTCTHTEAAPVQLRTV